MGKLIGVAMICGLAASPACAEPAGAEPKQALLADIRSGTPKTLRTFTLNGQQMSVVAYTRRARADTRRLRSQLHQAQAMDKVMPGYPQPALMTVDFKLWF